MTIIAAYPSDFGTVFVSDFRVTLNDGTQMDRCLKFFDVEGKLGLFLSGDALFWKGVIPEIAAEADLITEENLLQPDGPLSIALNMAAISYTGPSQPRALGFFLGSSAEHTLFTAIIFRESHCALRKADTNKAIVMGKGADIPNINKLIENSFVTYSAFHKNDLFLIGTGIRNEIVTKLQGLPNAFVEYGISPSMAISSLKDGVFVLHGEVRKGVTSSSDGFRFFKYKYSNGNDNKFLISDSLTGDSFSLVDLADLTEDIEGEKFDPENVT